MTCCIASISDSRAGGAGADAWLELGDRYWPVRVRATRRRTLGLYVFPDGRVEVRVPRGTGRAEALAFARSREQWLRGTLDQLPAPPAAPEYVDGAVHPYLGEPLTLAVRRAGRARSRRTGGTLRLDVRDPGDVAAVERLLREWYRRQARTLFADRLARWFPATGLPPGQAPGLKIRAMRSRWGSCSSRGGVNLNLWLIRAPLACIDYVVVHELCHLLEFNHGPRFYAHMDRMLPDWRQRRRALRDHQREWG